MDWTKILDFFKKPNMLFLFSVETVCIILIFASNSWIDELGLEKFITSAKPFISIVFLFITSYFAFYIVVQIWLKFKSFYNDYRIRKLRIEFLLESNPVEKYIIFKMYRNPSHSYDLDINDSTTVLLVQKQIIGQGSEISKGWFKFSFFLQRWVIEYIDMHPSFFNDLIDKKEQ